MKSNTAGRREIEHKLNAGSREMGSGTEPSSSVSSATSAAAFAASRRLVPHSVSSGGKPPFLPSPPPSPSSLPTTTALAGASASARRPPHPLDELRRPTRLWSISATRIGQPTTASGGLFGHGPSGIGNRMRRVGMIHHHDWDQRAPGVDVISSLGFDGLDL